jgi:hypothetical protein
MQVHRAILRGHIPVAVKLLTNSSPDDSVASSLVEELQIMSRVPDHRSATFDLCLTRIGSPAGGPLRHTHGC